MHNCCVVHSCGAQLWCTAAVHSTAVHSCGAQLWCTVPVHSAGAQLWCTAAVHNCGAPLRCTTRVHSCSAWLWCTAAVHSAGAQLWCTAVVRVHSCTTSALLVHHWCTAAPLVHHRCTTGVAAPLHQFAIAGGAPLRCIVGRVACGRGDVNTVLCSLAQKLCRSVICAPICDLWTDLCTAAAVHRCTTVHGATVQWCTTGSPVQRCTSKARAGHRGESWP